MYKNFIEQSKIKCSVRHESLVEGGLFGNIANVVGSILENTGGINQLLNYGSNIGISEPPVTQSNFIRYPGVSIAKSRYTEMKNQILAQRQLFWDSEYPANRIELPVMNQAVEWKRPFEIVQNPLMFSSGISRHDINQGKLGDCWLLAAIASLVMYPNLLTRVVPLDQSFNSGDYCGIFRFYIWYYGQWLEIIVDDLLPTSNGKLIYMNSKDLNEFWSPLLEKAYSKIFGSYKNLKGGITSEAMIDFTGGITEKIVLKKNIALSNNINAIYQLFCMILHSYTNQALMSCSKEGGLEFKDNSGLVSRHAYSVTAVCVINTNGYGQVNLIRLRNPWGNETEWRGPWSDGSYEWQCVPPQELQRLQIVRHADGEFWMSFNDFVNNFDKIEICHINPQSLEDLAQIRNREHIVKKSWELKVLYGEWKTGINAGGSQNHNTYYINPKLEFTINETDDGSAKGTGTIIISLMQRNMRMFNRELLAIGYTVYQKPRGNGIDQNIKNLTEIVSSGTYVDSREISGRHKLFLGTYIIIPSTYKPNEESQFLIRIFNSTKLMKS